MLSGSAHPAWPSNCIPETYPLAFQIIVYSTFSRGDPLGKTDFRKHSLRLQQYDFFIVAFKLPTLRSTSFSTPIWPSNLHSHRTFECAKLFSFWDPPASCAPSSFRKFTSPFENAHFLFSPSHSSITVTYSPSTAATYTGVRTHTEACCWKQRFAVLDDLLIADKFTLVEAYKFEICFSAFLHWISARIIISASLAVHKKGTWNSTVVIDSVTYILTITY